MSRLIYYPFVFPDETVVLSWAKESGESPGVRFGDGEWIPVPSHLMDLSGTVRDGQRMIIGQDVQDIPHAWVVGENGAVHDLGAVFGRDGVWVTPSSDIVLRSGFVYTVNGVESSTIPGGTTQGFAGILEDDGDIFPEWIDHHTYEVYRGVAVCRFNWSKNYAVGHHPTRDQQLVYDLQTDKWWVGGRQSPVTTPRLAVHPDGTATLYCFPGLISHSDGWVEYDPLALPPTPTIVPVKREVYCGWFFQYSDRYGDNRALPATVAFCETAGEGDRARRDGLPVIGPPEAGERIRTWFSRGSIEEVEQSVPGGADRLIYIDGPNHWLKRLPSNFKKDDWAGVQAYCGPEEDVQAFSTRLERELLTLKEKDVKIALIAQAYDRNGRETSLSKLEWLQAYFGSLLGRFDNIVCVLWFSDGRKGGSRNYPVLYQSQRETIGSVLRPKGRGGVVPEIPVPPVGNPGGVVPPTVPVPVKMVLRRGTSLTEGGEIMEVALKVGNKFLSIDPAFPEVVNVDRDEVGGWETFQAIPQTGGILFHLLSKDSKRLLCVGPDGKLQTRPETQDGEWEKFLAVENPDGSKMAHVMRDNRLIRSFLIEVKE